MDLLQTHNKWLSDKDIKLGKLATNQVFEFELNQNHLWPKELLLELDEKEKDQSFESNEFLTIKLSIVKKWDQALGDVVILEGKVLTDFQPPCIRCLINGKESLSFSFSACCIDLKYEADPDFEELTTYFIDGKDRELFYYENTTIDIFELIHELVYLNKKPFPLHDKNCLGLCFECGTNLNEAVCKHQKVS